MAKATKKTTKDEAAAGGAAEGVPAKPRSGSETRKRNKLLPIRLSDDERTEIEELSRKAGLTVGSYARQQMLQAKPPRSVRRPSLEREMTAQLLGQVGRVSGNLHQLVRHLNYGKEADRRRVVEVLDALDLLKREIMQALGRKPQGRP
jgi:hypothetical protein